MKKKTEEVVKVKKVGRPPKAAKIEKPAAKLVAKKDGILLERTD